MADIVEDRREVHPGERVDTAEDGPELSEALQAYIDRIAAGVPLKPEHRREIRDELEWSAVEHADVLRALGYRSYAADEQVMRRLGDPDTLTDRYNRVEALRSWFRDPLCLRALWRTGLAFLAWCLTAKLIVLAAGLLAANPQKAYELERMFLDVSLAASVLSGLFACHLYRSWSGNRHRFTPFVALSVALFILNGIVGCNLNFISPYPNPECRVFLWLDTHSLFGAGRTHLVYEFGLTGISLKNISDGVMMLAPTYTHEALSVLCAYALGIVIAITYIIEKVVQRPFNRFERI